MLPGKKGGINVASLVRPGSANGHNVISAPDTRPENRGVPVSEPGRVIHSGKSPPGRVPRCSRPAVIAGRSDIISRGVCDSCTTGQDQED